MNEDEVNRISSAWIKHTDESIGKKTIEYDNEGFYLDNLCQTDPLSALNIIFYISSIYSEEEIFVEKKERVRLILANLAAGPLEDILTNHGESFGRLEKPLVFWAGE